MLYSSALLYLRGIYYLTVNNILDGFKDFYSIELKELFPRRLIIDEILPMLTNEQKDLIQMQHFYKTASDHKRISNIMNSHIALVNSKFSIDIAEEGGYINLSDLSIISIFFLLYSKTKIHLVFQLITDFIQFCKKLDQLEIRIDSDTVKRLYKALTLEQYQSKVKIIIFLFNFR